MINIPQVGVFCSEIAKTLHSALGVNIRFPEMTQKKVHLSPTLHTELT